MDHSHPSRHDSYRLFTEAKQEEAAITLEPVSEIPPCRRFFWRRETKPLSEDEAKQGMDPETYSIYLGTPHVQRWISTGDLYDMDMARKLIHNPFTRQPMSQAERRRIEFHARLLDIVQRIPGLDLRSDYRSMRATLLKGRTPPDVFHLLKRYILGQELDAKERFLVWTTQPEDLTGVAYWEKYDRSAATTALHSSPVGTWLLRPSSSSECEYFRLEGKPLVAVGFGYAMSYRTREKVEHWYLIHRLSLGWQVGGDFVNLGSSLDYFSCLGDYIATSNVSMGKVWVEPPEAKQKLRADEILPIQEPVLDPIACLTEIRHVLHSVLSPTLSDLVSLYLRQSTESQFLLPMLTDFTTLQLVFRSSTEFWIFNRSGDDMLVVHEDIDGSLLVHPQMRDRDVKEAPYQSREWLAVSSPQGEFKFTILNNSQYLLERSPEHQTWASGIFLTKEIHVIACDWDASSKRGLVLCLDDRMDLRGASFSDTKPERLKWFGIHWSLENLPVSDALFTLACSIQKNRILLHRYLWNAGDEQCYLHVLPCSQ